MLLTIALLAFCLSFIFALGGVGSAVALVPALIAIGVPGGVARPIALLVNTVSLGGGTIYNLKTGKFKPGPWWLLILFSLPAAPLGAWVSTLIPHNILSGVFAGFMVFSGFLMIAPARKSQQKEERNTCPPVGGALIGAVSGVVSGMLGVGGGGVIIPALYAMRFRSHHIAMITAMAVPFSSFTGFIAYAAMGSLNITTVVVASLAALAGGTIGTRAMHRIDQRLVKMFLSITLIISGGRIIWKLVA
ncbi:sulfite exporter TauE/SafE family protein [Desulfotalea psychrophila]|uniref:Probable membrane transporter protein n=1 Tax=Desulfotalea psychrophila (strain LSv54 / DSM 12343) TaxID=177439 RepID=Q6ALB4_DESPS|nr:sulfite exporter TauE/SafE family protein [Desulfotalea psychrophila]CAG36861.1 conserved hypothetical membrane protein [Desulfotalea psychrophila LSv54]